MPDKPSDPPPQKPFQFTLTTLLLLMVLLSIVFVPLTELIRYSIAGGQLRAQYLLIPLLAPLGLLALLGLARAIWRWFHRTGPRKPRW